MSSPTTSEPRHESQPPGGNSQQSNQSTASADVGETAAETTASTDTAQSESERGPLSLDLVFEILKNSRRREVLRYLEDHDEQVTLSELAEHVAAIENDTTVQALSSQQRKRVYVGLYQCHLPKLDDMDVIEFNQSRGHVELGPNASQLDKYLYMNERDETERPWYQYYLGFSALAAVLLVGVAAIGAVGSVGALAVSGAVVLGVTVLSVLQAYELSE